MGRTGKAIDAAMFAAAIGIDRPVEPHIGRGVARDHPARALYGNFGAQGRQVFVPVPAVMDRDAGLRLEPADIVAGGRASAAAVLVDLALVHATALRAWRRMRVARPPRRSAHRPMRRSVKLERNENTLQAPLAIA